MDENLLPPRFNICERGARHANLLSQLILSEAETLPQVSDSFP
jgi:hypothetical protein